MPYAMNMTLSEYRKPENQFAWRGAIRRQIVAIMDDGQKMCHECIQQSEVHNGEDGNDGWRFMGTQIHHPCESDYPELCAHCAVDLDTM